MRFATSLHVPSARLAHALVLACAALLLLFPQGAFARSVLFVGNSFTYCGGSPVWKFHPEKVEDLNGHGVGGMPALFKMFAEQAGLDYQVSLETSGGTDLQWHWENRRAVLDRAWDEVVLQDFSTLDREQPGDPAGLIRYSGALADMFRKRNPQVRVSLLATFSRPDLTYVPGKPWFGKGIYAMAADLRAAYDQAVAANPAIAQVVPVGEAFNLAMMEGVADPNPYDGIAFGQVDLWTFDHYHASATGCYLEALTTFGAITGVDPRSLGANEIAAQELGLAPAVVERLQEVAARLTLEGGS